MLNALTRSNHATHYRSASVYGLPLVCKHPVLWRVDSTAHVYPASELCIAVPIPGHDGLFARRLPIGLSCFSHLLTHGFSRRRFDLFAIDRLALQS
jgi:hypothetical protein